jgi:hypothetical protein
MEVSKLEISRGEENIPVLIARAGEANPVFVFDQIRYSEIASSLAPLAMTRFENFRKLLLQCLRLLLYNRKRRIRQF